jgi:DNA-binding NarL/FixJ family response regulator
MALRLIICCSNVLFAEGIEKLLEREVGIHIVGVLHGIESQSAMAEARSLQPDILLLDSNINLNILLSFPDDFYTRNETKILIIGDKNIKHVVNRSLHTLMSRGLVGVLPPSADSDILRKALKSILVGELWLDRATLMKIVTSMKQASRTVRLAHREKEIITHICQGYKNKEIAQKLQISEQTVKSHCNRIYKKLGVSDRLQLALQSHRIFPEENKGRGE